MDTDKLIQEGNRLGQEASKQTGVAFTPLKPNTASATDLMAGSSPLVTRPQVPPTSSAGLVDSALSLGESAKTAAQTEIDRLKTERESQKTEAKGLFARLGMVESNRNDLYEDEGVNTLKKEVDSIDSQMKARDLYYRRQIENLQDKNPEGLFGGALDDRINDLTRENAREQADMAITLAAKTGQLDTVQSIIDSKVDAETEAMKTQLDSLKFFLEDNRDFLTTAQAREYEKEITEDERAYNEIRDTKKQIGELQFEAAANGAPQSVVSAIGRATSFDEAVQSAGQYIGLLDRMNTYSAIAERNESSTPANFITPPIVNPQTGKLDPVSQLVTVIDSADAKDNQRLQDILGVVAAAQKFAEGNPDGKFAGLGPVRFGSKFQSQAGTSNQGAVEAINLKVQQWASGASLTAEQIEQVKRFTPKLSDTDKEVRQKVNSLTNFMLTQTTGILGAQGIPYQPETIDFFNPITDDLIAEMDRILSQ